MSKWTYSPDPFGNAIFDEVGLWLGEPATDRVGYLWAAAPNLLQAAIEARAVLVTALADYQERADDDLEDAQARLATNVIRRKLERLDAAIAEAERWT